MTRKLKPIEVLKAQCEAQGVEFDDGRNPVYGPYCVMTCSDWQLRVYLSLGNYSVLVRTGDDTIPWRYAMLTGEVVNAIRDFLYEPEEPPVLQPQPVSWAVTAGGYSFKCESVQAAEWLATALLGK